jgi:predicted Rossmann fold flavoprotein
VSEAQGFDHDVAVLGGGAAGLFAAFRAAELGRKVVLLEKNRRPGVKILMSGGTRCNLTNARGLRNLRVVSGPIAAEYDPREARGARSIQAAFGENGAFLGPSLKAFGVEETVALFEAEGVGTYVEPNGKVFPASNRAADVLAALVRRVERSGAELRTNASVADLTRLEGGGFSVRTAGGGELTARTVVLAMGGQSFPGCGTRGDGFALARTLGHTIVEPRPALVPIRVGAAWVKELSGLTVPDAVASVVDGQGRMLMDRREAVLFAHFGLTGPAILDVSRAVARAESVEEVRLRLDLVPTRKAGEIDAEVQARARQGRPAVAGLLPVPRRLADAVMVAAGVSGDRTGPELTREERTRLVGCLKGLELPVAGTLGFEKAEVTSGGVRLEEVDPRSLASRVVPGLYFCGEVLDLDGRIGGYNFQAAWSTGWLAGERAGANE